MDVIFLAAASCLPAFLTKQCILGGSTSAGSSSNSSANMATTTTTTTTPSSGGRSTTTKKELWSVMVTLGLSFALFALGILEAAPSSCLWLLDHRFEEHHDVATSVVREEKDHHVDGNGPSAAFFAMAAAPRRLVVFHKGRLTLTAAYHFLLWALTIWILIVLPSVTGSQLVGQFLTNSLVGSTTTSTANTTTTTAGGGAAAADPDDEKKRSFRPKKRYFIFYFSARVVSLLFRVVYYGAVFACGRMIPSSCRRRRGQQQQDVLPRVVTRTRSNSSDLGASASATGDGAKKKRRPFLRFWCGSGATRKSVFVGSTFAMFVTISVLGMVGPAVVQTSSTETTPNVLCVAVSWLTAVGILLSALLNGFGSVSMPHSCLAGLWLEPISSAAIAKADLELQRVRESLEERREDLKSIGLSVAQTPTSSSHAPASNNTSQPSGGGGSIMRSWTTAATMTKQRNGFASLGEEISLKRKQLATEIEFLETLVEEMHQDAIEMRHSQQMAAGARTWRGQVKSWLGIVFSAVLLVRLAAALWSLRWGGSHIGNGASAEPPVHHRHHYKSDPVTTALVWLTGHTHLLTSQQDYNSCAQFISLVLTAILSVSQVRTFLRTVNAVQRRLVVLYRKCYCLPRTRRNNNNAMNATTTEVQESADDIGVNEEQDNTKQQNHRVAYSSLLHVLACLAGSYFLACLVLTKMMLPVAYRQAFTAALLVGADDVSENGGGGGGHPFRIRFRAVNLAFSASAVASASVLGILLAIQRQNTCRHNSYHGNNADHRIGLDA